MAAEAVELLIEGRALRVSSPDKSYFPELWLGWARASIGSSGGSSGSDTGASSRGSRDPGSRLST